ncbi:MAG TPA: hypothetical protein VFT74_13500 [Isosphaeraceae bacterium]|nr:hypothetical protein [Isosphaeraceae bacterium]
MDAQLALRPTGLGVEMLDRPVLARSCGGLAVGREGQVGDGFGVGRPGGPFLAGLHVPNANLPSVQAVETIALPSGLTARPLIQRGFPRNVFITDPSEAFLAVTIGSSFLGASNEYSATATALPSAKKATLRPLRSIRT